MDRKEFERHKWMFLEKWSYLWEMSIKTEKYKKARYMFEQELNNLLCSPISEGDKKVINNYLDFERKKYYGI